MDKLDKEYNFENGRYKQNRESLKKQVENLVDINKQVVLDMRSELLILRSCKTTADYQRYFATFPKGKHTVEARKQMERCEVEERKIKEKREFELCKTVQDCKKFIAKYPNTQYPIKEKEEICFYQSCKTYDDIVNYINTYPRGRFKNEAENILKDERYWKQCIAANTRSMYREYLSRFPNGRHKVMAEEKARACYIATMVYGDYEHPQVVLLRKFRDTVLRNSAIGNVFIRFYYKHSPSWVEKLQDKTVVNRAIRSILDNIIKVYIKINTHEK